MTRRLLLLVLLCISISASAQAERLMAGETLQLSISAAAPTMRLYEAKAGETIQLSARAIEAGENTPDLVLWIIFDGQLLAYNDNHGELPNPSLKLNLSEAGLYSIYVDSFNGVGEGTVELLLELVDPFQLEITEEEETIRLLVHLPASRIFRYSFEAEGSLMIRATDTSGNLDPYIRLLNNSEEILGENDDHASHDFSLGLFDSRLLITVPKARYFLEAYDYLGNAGQLEILIRHN
jgi:hypothetical protein